MSEIRTDNFATDGFIGCTRLIPSSQALEYRHNLEDFIRIHGEHPQFADWCYFKSHMILPWLVDLAKTPGVANAVTRVLGPDFLLWNSFIPVKAPDSQGHFAWHQDATYWHLTPVDGVMTIWLALSHVSAENGGMRFIPGSHHQGQLRHEMTLDSKSMLRRGQQVIEAVDESAAVTCRLQPGEASIHHPLTLHGSAGNKSDQWRLAVAFNFISADADPKPGYSESAMHIAGVDRNQSFERDPAPTDVLSDEALRALDHATSLAAARYGDVTSEN